MCCCGPARKPAWGQWKVRWHRLQELSLQSESLSGRWEMTQLCATCFLFTLNSFFLSLLEVQHHFLWGARDYGFRNEPQNKTGYCGDTNLGILYYSGKWSGNDKDWPARVYSDEVLHCSSFTCKGNIFLLGTFCLSLVNHWIISPPLQNQSSQWMWFPNRSNSRYVHI